MNSAKSISAACDRIALDEHLPGWDYADAYQFVLGTHGVQAADVARIVLRPRRVGRAVLSLRDLAMRPFGIAPVAGAGDALFPVLHEDCSLVVLGLDDRHLDFRVLIQVEHRAVRCTTAVRRHSNLGRLYFSLVGPVHRQLVPHLLARCGRVGLTSSGAQTLRPTGGAASVFPPTLMQEAPPPWLFRPRLHDQLGQVGGHDEPDALSSRRAERWSHVRSASA